MKKLKNVFIATAGLAVMLMAGLTVTAEKAEAAYCAPRIIPAGCFYQEIGRCFGINCGAKMGLVRSFPGWACPQTYCESLDYGPEN